MTKASSCLSATTEKCDCPSAAADWGYILTLTDGRQRRLEMPCTCSKVQKQSRFIENSVIRQRFLTAHDGKVTTNTSNISARPPTEKCIERLSAAKSGLH